MQLWWSRRGRAGGIFAEETTGVVTLRVEIQGRPLAAAEARAGRTYALTDESGRAVLRLPAGTHAIAVRLFGQATATRGDISMMLNETSGLRVQTTSASFGGANVRVQGLRGRYTQILSDGLPLHGAQIGALSMLQIPPMDPGAGRGDQGPRIGTVRRLGAGRGRQSHLAAPRGGPLIARQSDRCSSTAPNVSNRRSVRLRIKHHWQSFS